MFTILHGDHEVAVSTERSKIISVARQAGKDVVFLDGKKLAAQDIAIALGSDALFAAEKLIVIDRFFIIPKGARREECVTLLTKDVSSSIDILLCEMKPLTAIQAKVFPSATIRPFMLPKLLFAWVEGVGSVPLARSLEQFHAVLEHEDAFVCWSMLIRQVRFLLAFACDGTCLGAPFMRAKLQSQARAFSLEKLKALHTKLLLIDERQKTSGSKLTLTQEIDLFLAEL